MERIRIYFHAPKNIRRYFNQHSKLAKKHNFSSSYQSHQKAWKKLQMANSELPNEMEHFLELNGIKFKVIFKKSCTKRKANLTKNMAAWRKTNIVSFLRSSSLLRLSSFFRSSSILRSSSFLRSSGTGRQTGARDRVLSQADALTKNKCRWIWCNLMPNLDQFWTHNQKIHTIADS